MFGLKEVAVQEITITHHNRTKYSNMEKWNYDLNGVPFGQVYSFKARGEVHPFTVKTAKGEFVGQYPTYKEADIAIRGVIMN